MSGCDFRFPIRQESSVSGGVPVTQGSRAVAGLKELPSGEKSDWRVPENLVTEGTETFSRVVTGAGLLAPQALEMAAGLRPSDGLL